MVGYVSIGPMPAKTVLPLQVEIITMEEKIVANVPVKPILKLIEHTRNTIIATIVVAWAVLEQTSLSSL